MDRVPPWQHINEGYESPTEATFKRVKAAKSLEEWKQQNPQRAAQILGKNNTKLRQPGVRFIIWPAEERHSDSELRSIWKYCYTRCWHLAPYAFNSDLKPYAEFAWVTSPTAFRYPARSSSRAIAKEPATATTSVVGTVKQTESLLDNRRLGAAIADSIIAEPPPNAPCGPRNSTPSRAPRFPRLYPITSKGPSRDLGRSGETLLSPPSRSPSTHPPKSTSARTSSITTTLPSSPWHGPELVHPLRRPFVNSTGPVNAALQDQFSVQTLDHPKRAQFSYGPTRNSGSPSQQEVGQVRMPYLPTPGPSSYGARPYAKPTTDIRSPNRGYTKTPGPLDGKQGVGSVELGTPRLRTTYENLSLTAAQKPVAAQLPQPMRSASQALSATEKPACKTETCNRTHAGECFPVCSDCSRRHKGKCHHCDICSKRHTGECRYCEKCKSVHYAKCRECSKCKTWHVGWCSMCKTCEKRHTGACAFARPLPPPPPPPPPKPQLFISGPEEKVASPITESLQSRKKTTPLPEVVAKGVKTPMRARQRNATTPITPGTATSTRSAATPQNEIESCKHRQKGKECERCTCGCGQCHRPEKRCLKQRAEARAGKRKANDADVKVDADDLGVKVEGSVSHAQLSLQPKKKLRTRDAVDPVVKVEASSSHAQLSVQPKSKKTKTRRSVGSWYDPIAVD